MKKKILIITMAAASMALSACGNKAPETPVVESQVETSIEETETESESETETEMETEMEAVVQAPSINWENAQIKLINCSSYIGGTTKKDFTSICFAVEMPDAENEEWMNEVPDIAITDSSGTVLEGMGHYTMFEEIGALYRKNVEGKIEPGTFTVTFPDGSSVKLAEYVDDATAANYKVFRLDDGCYYLNNTINSGTGSGSDENGNYRELLVIMNFENVGPDINGKFNAPATKGKLELFMPDGTPMVEALGADSFTSGSAGETKIEFRFNGGDDLDLREMWDSYITKSGTYMEYTRADGAKIKIPLFEG